MDRNMLTLIGFFLITILIVVIVQAFIVVNFIHVQQSGTVTIPPSGGGNLPRPSSASTSLTPEQEHIKAVIGGIGTLIGAFIAGVISFLVFWFGIRTTTRNAFLDMVIGENGYRAQLKEFLYAVNDKDIIKVKQEIDTTALSILLIRKPKLKEKIKKSTDINKVVNLTGKIFTE
jgi:hypothetical protein